MDGNNLFNCAIGFISFSFLASAIYVINDIADLESDRKHPTKRNRPIANGTIPLPLAFTIAGLLLAVSFGISIMFLTQKAIMLLLLYFVLNILYSFKLKAVSLLDIFIISFFFEIRLFLGGELGHIEISHWLSLLTFFLAAFIAFSKRHDDFVLSTEMNTGIRKSIKDYNLEYLNMILLLLATVILVIYVLYSISETGGEKFNVNFYQTGLFVFLGICRYLQLILVEKKHGSPVKIFYTDKITLFTCLAWLASILYFIYC